MAQRSAAIAAARRQAARSRTRRNPAGSPRERTLGYMLTSYQHVTFEHRDTIENLLDW
jgi:hypothetical protein